MNQSQNHHTQNKISWRLTVEEHAKVMKGDKPSTCCPGGTFEVSLFSDVMHVNVTVYCEATDNIEMCVKSEECSIYMASEAPTIHLLRTNDGTCYNKVKFTKNTKLWDDTVEQLESELQGLKVEDLKRLYTHISKNLEDQNGYVADFNQLLTSLMGCNSNSLLLGSNEQSKGALFYVGPYICKTLVPIIDSFSFALLLEAQGHAQNHPLRADDASIDEGLVQYVLTRVLNNMNSLMDISDTQAAVGLLGMNAGFCCRNIMSTRRSVGR